MDSCFQRMRLRGLRLIRDPCWLRINPPPQQATSVSLSSSAQFNNQFKIASSIENVVQVGHDLDLPQKFHIGGLYSVGPATIMISLEKESALPLEVNLGLLFTSETFWEVGLGYRDLSGGLSAGWRIHLGKIACHYVFVIHPYLPVSQGFGLEFTLP